MLQKLTYALDEQLLTPLIIIKKIHFYDFYVFQVQISTQIHNFMKKLIAVVLLCAPHLQKITVKKQQQLRKHCPTTTMTKMPKKSQKPTINPNPKSNMKKRKISTKTTKKTNMAVFQRGTSCTQIKLELVFFVQCSHFVCDSIMQSSLYLLQYFLGFNVFSPL